MAQSQSKRLPRGINFLLGGSVVAVSLFLLAMVSGTIDIGVGGAPDVRIDQPIKTVDAGQT